MYNYKNNCIDYSYMNICIYTISIIGIWKEGNLFIHV